VLKEPRDADNLPDQIAVRERGAIGRQNSRPTGMTTG
jgi:hypothetical protein